MKRVRSHVLSVSGGGAPVSVDPFTDAFSLGINFTETANAVPTDVDSYLINLAQSDTTDVQSETVSLAFPSPDFGDSNTAPTDSDSFTLRAWCSLTAATGSGATNPNNVNGANDGTVGTLQSAPAGATTNIFDSVLGANLPAGITITSAILRLYFKSVNTLVTSNGDILDTGPGNTTFLHNAALNTTVDNLASPLTVDLIALGYSVANIRALALRWRTIDAAAGVTPHVMTVDAASIDIAGAFT